MSMERGREFNSS